MLHATWLKIRKQTVQQGPIALHDDAHFACRYAPVATCNQACECLNARDCSGCYYHAYKSTISLRDGKSNNIIDGKTWTSLQSYTFGSSFVPVEMHARWTCHAAQGWMTTLKIHAINKSSQSNCVVAATQPFAISGSSSGMHIKQQNDQQIAVSKIPLHAKRASGNCC